MAWGSKKKNDPSFSYFSRGVTLEGRLCFSGVVRLDGRVNGEIISTGTLVVEETAVITGDVMVENIILSGTVYGNIQAAKQAQLNASAKVYGHISYGELSIEGALHEGSSHKLSPEEIAEVQQDCQDFLEEASASAEKSKPDPSALEEYSATLANAEKQAASALLGKKNEVLPRKKAAGGTRGGGRAAEAPAKAAESSPKTPDSQSGKDGDA